MNPRLLGAFGESVAAAYYRRQGYQVERANYRTRLGEVDLIVEKDGALVFVEVKARGPGALAAPGEAVTPRKQRRLIAAAQAYLALQNCADRRCRFDVVEVRVDEDGEPRLHCIENAFTL